MRSEGCHGYHHFVTSRKRHLSHFYTLSLLVARLTQIVILVLRRHKLLLFIFCSRFLSYNFKSVYGSTSRHWAYLCSPLIASELSHRFSEIWKKGRNSSSSSSSSYNSSIKTENLKVYEAEL